MSEPTKEEKFNYEEFKWMNYSALLEKELKKYMSETEIEQLQEKLYSEARTKANKEYPNVAKMWEEIESILKA